MRKRVSLGNLRSMSLIDSMKIPDNDTYTTFETSTLNMEWQEQEPLVVPPLPFSSNEKLSSMMDSPAEERVRDRPSQRTNKETPRTKGEKSTKVISLPWTDSRGIRGEYSGEINSSIQPHGKGTFRADDGSIVGFPSSTWINGKLVAAKIPEDHSLNNNNSSSDSLLRSGTKLTRPKLNSPEHRRSTTLTGYKLGDTAKHPSHMYKLPRKIHPKVAIMNADSLKPLDFAFVRRNNRKWVYSIVAGRKFIEGELAIIFVLNEKGSIKTIGKKYWAKVIRLVNTTHMSGIVSAEPGGNDPISKEESRDCNETKKRRKERVANITGSKISRKLDGRRSAKIKPELMSANSCSTNVAVVVPNTKSSNIDYGKYHVHPETKVKSSADRHMLGRFDKHHPQGEDRAQHSSHGELKYNASTVHNSLQTVNRDPTDDQAVTTRRDSYESNERGDTSTKKNISSSPINRGNNEEIPKRIGRTGASFHGIVAEGPRERSRSRESIASGVSGLSTLFREMYSSYESLEMKKSRMTHYRPTSNQK
mmetsp:Transcript_4498/g.10068  ORF Transcript_4498/g.10068 Transcript_4498/m.10068 type:complete len:533 (+) Transcript_4498:92-1690(+)